MSAADPNQADSVRVLRININLGALAGQLKNTVAQIAGRLSLIAQCTEKLDFHEFSIGRVSRFQFWPDDISDEMQTAVRNDFCRWGMAACFRDLEQSYNLFLDQVGIALDAASMNNFETSDTLVLGDKYRKINNTANKHKTITDMLDVEDYLESLNSISLCRNALTHNMGIVRKRDCNSDDSLNIWWLSMNSYLDRGCGEVRIDANPFDTSKLPGDGPAKLFLKFERRERAFKIGQSIEFEADDLSELCFFYVLLADKVVAATQKFLSAAGIPVSGESDTTTSK